MFENLRIWSGVLVSWPASSLAGRSSLTSILIGLDFTSITLSTENSSEKGVGFWQVNENNVI